MRDGERELRLALGMRGGVSLAVWIGGACAEIDDLRRAREDQSGLWTSLTRTTGHGSVVVDVMAGASAGGLNGVLFAACQAYGVRFSEMRQTWLDVGSTEQLVRTAEREERDGTPANLRWLSLFRGDGHMFRQIVVQLTKLIDAAGTSRPADPPRLDLRLSATHVEPVLRAVRSPTDETLLDRRYASEFRFVAPQEAWLGNDFPPYAAPGEPGRERFEGHLARLALAARTTSSYPGAFEAASVRSSRVATFTADEPDPTPGLDVDMAGIFADRTTGGPFVVADGGIVDNIPLARAFDAIADAPAQGPTDRHLVYLHPGAPSVAGPTEPDPPTDEQRRSIVSVLRAAAGTRLVGEDISGDIARIDDHNRAVDRAAAVRRATFAPLASRADLLEAAASARDNYLGQRSDEDCRLIGSLLDDPLGFLGEDPFPATVGSDATGNGAEVDDARWRSPLGPFPASQRRAFSTRIDERMTARLDGWAAGDVPDVEIYRTGARPLRRTTRTLLEWARFVEQHAPTDERSGASAAKSALYRVLAFAEVAVERPRRLAWVALVATAPTADGRAAADRTLDRLAGLTTCTDDDADRVSGALLAGRDDVLRTLVRDARVRVEAVSSGAWPAAASSAPQGDDGDRGAAGGPPADIRCEIATRVLVPLAEQLRRVAVRIDRASTAESSDPAHHLQRVLGTDEEIGIPVLAALEVACYGEYATGAPGRRPVEFVRLSAANPTPLAPRFAAVEDDARTQQRWWDRSQKVWARQEGIHVELKLAGNELSNFSAFLREEWRANDWMWGRLDAVPTLVGLTVTPAALAGRPADELASEIEAIVTADGPVASLGREVWDELGDEVRAELRALGTTDDPATASLTTTRRALVMRRQWEILADELGAGEQVAERVERYRVGAATIRDHDVRAEIQDRLTEIVRTAANTVLTNAHANGFSRWGTGAAPTWRGRLTRFGIRGGGRFGIRKVLGR